MPTPFTHLEIAQRLLQDSALDDALRDALQAARPAFLLGSVAPDARVPGHGRDATHFYHYDVPITEHPWRVMLSQYPTLKQADSAAQRVFLAGYTAHLAVDEAWSLKMVRPHFVEKDWKNRPRHFRLIALHLILIAMDQRDRAKLASWQSGALAKAGPDDWLPFMSDAILREWRDFIAGQIAPDGESQTLDIFSRRIMIPLAELRAMVESPETMQERLWDYVSRETLAAVEDAIYRFAREQMQTYLDEFG